jgi:hypothetical protein
MGKRSRRREGGEATPAPAPPPPPAPVRPRRRSIDDRPKPPWHPFPLVELCVLIGIVCFVLGVLDLDSDRGRLLLLCGMTLGSLAGLDTALREHFTGYRSHTTVLAAIPGVITAGTLFFARAPWPAVTGAAIAVFAAAFAALHRAYRRRSGVV